MLKRTGPIALIALSTLLMPQGSVEAQTAAPAALQGCLANVYCTMGLVVIGGISYWSITQNGHTQTLPVQHGGYLEDPEGQTEEWEDRIWANSLDQAIRKCRAYAGANGVAYVGVSHWGGNAYTCRVRTYST